MALRFPGSIRKSISAAMCGISLFNMMGGVAVIEVKDSRSGGNPAQAT
jgi:hypothetical protein